MSELNWAQELVTRLHRVVVQTGGPDRYLAANALRGTPPRKKWAFDPAPTDRRYRAGQTYPRRPTVADDTQ